MTIVCIEEVHFVISNEMKCIKKSLPKICVNYQGNFLTLQGWGKRKFQSEINSPADYTDRR
jgi:hypothetical protein